MCEFCSYGPNSNKHKPDSLHHNFFSAEAIEAAIQQAKERKRRNEKAKTQEAKETSDEINSPSSLSRSNSIQSMNDNDRGIDDCGDLDEDDDGT